MKETANLRGKEIKQLNIRISEELLNRFAQIASDHGRTQNGEAVKMMETYIEEESNMVRVESNGKTAGYVKYTHNLDQWDGANWQYGVGQHRGITIWHSQFVVVYGSDFENSTYGEVVSVEEAKIALFSSGNKELINRFFPSGITQEELSDDVDLRYKWGMLN